jgi:hypothetical protein
LCNADDVKPEGPATPHNHAQNPIENHNFAAATSPHQHGIITGLHPARSLPLLGTCQFIIIKFTLPSSHIGQSSNSAVVHFCLFK